MPPRIDVRLQEELGNDVIAGTCAKQKRGQKRQESNRRRHTGARVRSQSRTMITLEQMIMMIKPPGQEMMITFVSLSLSFLHPRPEE